MKKLFLILIIYFSYCQSDSQILKLPVRQTNALKGSEFINMITSFSRNDRENEIYSQVAKGNIPNFMRNLCPIVVNMTITGFNHSITYYVTPDYMAVGSDEDYFLTPMSPLLGQRLANLLDCSLPTRKMVNDIYSNASVKLKPQPIPPSAAMITVPVFKQHNDSVRQLRQEQIGNFPLGSLTGGNKKDVIISNYIYNNLKPTVPKPVVIYGWHQLNGQPIQPLYNGHEETYADYSHGIRLVQMSVIVDGLLKKIPEVLNDSILNILLSDEGIISKPRYTVSESQNGVKGTIYNKPEDIFLSQNYPNPFNPVTIIHFYIPGFERVTIKLFDQTGRELQTLVNDTLPAGDHSVVCNLKDNSSGVYYYTLSTSDYFTARSMIKLK